MVIRPLKKLIRGLVSDYSLYKIYSLSLPSVAREPTLEDEFEFVEINAEEQIISDCAAIISTREYFGNQSHGFGVFQAKELAAVCWFWYGQRYETRNFWPLNPGEAKLIQVTTGESFKKRGLGSALMGYSISQMKALGFTTLYARIWHSNTPSIKLFEKTGWQKTAFVLEAVSLGLKIRYEYYDRACVSTRKPGILPFRLKLSRHRG